MPTIIIIFSDKCYAIHNIINDMQYILFEWGNTYGDNAVILTTPVTTYPTFVGLFFSC